MQTSPSLTGQAVGHGLGIVENWKAVQEISTPGFRIIKPSQKNNQLHSSSHHGHHSNSNSQLSTPPHQPHHTNHTSPAASASSTSGSVATLTNSPAIPTPSNSRNLPAPLTSSRGRIIKLKLRADEDGGTSWTAASPSPPPEPTPTSQTPSAKPNSDGFATPAPITPAKRKAEHSLDIPAGSSSIHSPSTVNSTDPQPVEPVEEEDWSDLGMSLRHSRALHQLKREYVLNTLKRHKLKRSISTPRTPNLMSAAGATSKTPKTSNARGAMKLMREGSLGGLPSQSGLQAPSSPTSMSPLQSPMNGAGSQSQSSSMDWSNAATTNQSLNNNSHNNNTQPPPSMSRQSSLEPFSLTPMARGSSQQTASQDEDVHMQCASTSQQSDDCKQDSQSLQQSGTGSLVLHPSAKEEEKESSCPSPTSDCVMSESNMFDVNQSVFPLPTSWSLQSAGIDPSSMYYLKAWQPSPSMTQESFPLPKFNYDPLARPWKIPKKYILCFTPPLDQHARQLATLHSMNPNANIITLPAAAFFKNETSATTTTNSTDYSSDRESRSTKKETELVEPPIKKKKSAPGLSLTRTQSSKTLASSVSSSKGTIPTSARARAQLDAELVEKQKLLAYLQVRGQYLKVLQAQENGTTLPSSTTTTESIQTPSTTTTTTTTKTPKIKTPKSALAKSERKQQTRLKKEQAAAAAAAAQTGSGTVASTPRTPRSQAGTPRQQIGVTAASPINAPSTAAAVVKAESVRADTPPTASVMLVPSQTPGVSPLTGGPLNNFSLPMLTGTSAALTGGGVGSLFGNPAGGSTLPDLSSLFPFMPPLSYDASQLQIAGMDLSQMMLLAQNQLALSILNPAAFLSMAGPMAGLMFPFTPQTTTATTNPTTTAATTTANNLSSTSSNSNANSSSGVNTSSNTTTTTTTTPMDTSTTNASSTKSS